MKVEVVNTGTELLLGAVVNSHLAYFGAGLFSVGLRIDRGVTVPDGAAIRDALVEAFDRGVEVVLVTGGLGPTTDDVTREIVAELLGLRLVRDEAVLRGIKDLCAGRGFDFQERMGRQAMVPEGAVVLPNRWGTAPGLYVPPVDAPSWRSPHLFLLPGPPRELRPMFEAEVLPRLRELTSGTVAKICRTYRCVGIGESMVEARLGLRLEGVAGIEVGYCARSNEVDLRLIGEVGVLDSVDAEVRAELAEFLVTMAAEGLETVVVNELVKCGLTIATAESCTGGLLASRLTDVPGSSSVFLRGWVTYANEAKVAELGVDAGLIEAAGAVSEGVARAMAVGACERAGTDFALATTGIAGPGGATEGKPVGTVFIALARRGGEVKVWRESFPTDRVTFKMLVTQAALNELRRAVMDGVEPIRPDSGLGGMGSTPSRIVSRKRPAHFPPPEQENRSIIVFLTVCTKNRRSVLANADMHDRLRRWWGLADRWRVGRYVVMPDHVHLFCSPGSWPPSSLGDWVTYWRGQVAREVMPGEQLGKDGRRGANASGGDEGPGGTDPSIGGTGSTRSSLWQRDYWDTQLRRGESYSAKWEYVRHNPVRARLVSDVEAWGFQGEMSVLEWHDA